MKKILSGDFIKALEYLERYMKDPLLTFDEYCECFDNGRDWWVYEPKIWDLGNK